MSSNAILLRGGTVLMHDQSDHVNSVEADLLLEGNTIKKIEKGILANSDTEVIDCTGKIISPGFIDTHHHVWQTLLKGRHADKLLLDYFPSGKQISDLPILIYILNVSGNFTSSLHNPADFFWGELGGCLECLDVGTTTVVDHAHMNYSPEHSTCPPSVFVNILTVCSKGSTCRNNLIRCQICVLLLSHAAC